MDCNIPVDDECAVYETKTPKKIPLTDNHDWFFVKFEIRTTTVPILDSEEEDEDYRRLEEADVDTMSLRFWTRCRRSLPNSLSKDVVRRMLTKAGVPRCKQDFMSESIAFQANRIANANKDTEVVALRVSIDIFGCACYGESVEDE